MDFDLAGPKKRFVAPSSKTSRASVESQAVSLAKEYWVQVKLAGKIREACAEHPRRVTAQLDLSLTDSAVKSAGLVVASNLFDNVWC